MSAVEAVSISKSFGSLKAVDNLSFSIAESTCTGFLGPNGAGKTTMMRMIYGRCRRDNPDKSRISVFGHDPLRNELVIKNLSGVVSQDNNLDTELNVSQNLMVYARFYAIPVKEAKGRIERLLELMDLKDKIKTRIRELSGGMKRRLVIARALINEPKLLILDEPTTGLDPQVRHAIWEKIRRLKKDGLTVLLTTHYMEEAFQIADKVVIMHRGKKLLEGEPKSIVSSQIEPFVLELLKHDNLPGLEKDAECDVIRTDLSGDIPMFYSREFETLKKLADTLDAGDFILRQSNLEDVFLKTTGRGLKNAR